MAKNLAISYLLDVYAPVLTDKQREVVELYYNEDLSLAEIAENCGITRQGVRDSIKRGESVLNELETKLGFAGKLRVIAESAEDIRRCASDILLHNSRSAYSEQVRLLAEIILEKVKTIERE